MTTPYKTGTTRRAGNVKWFNDAKGYGFITVADGGMDVFVHYSSVIMAGRKTLQDGAAVTFDIAERPKGPMAINVEPL